MGHGCGRLANVWPRLLPRMVGWVLVACRSARPKRQPACVKVDRHRYEAVGRLGAYARATWQLSSGPRGPPRQARLPRWFELLRPAPLMLEANLTSWCRSRTATVWMRSIASGRYLFGDLGHRCFRILAAGQRQWKCPAHDRG